MHPLWSRLPPGSGGVGAPNNVEHEECVRDPQRPSAGGIIVPHPETNRRRQQRRQRMSREGVREPLHGAGGLMPLPQSLGSRSDLPPTAVGNPGASSQWCGCSTFALTGLGSPWNQQPWTLTLPQPQQPVLPWKCRDFDFFLLWGENHEGVWRRVQLVQAD